jgi:hypothetical protein
VVKNNLLNDVTKSDLTGHRSTYIIDLSIKSISGAVGNLSRYVFDDVANLGLVYIGLEVPVSGCTNSDNNGTFKIIHVNDELGNKYLVLDNEGSVEELAPASTAKISLKFEVRGLHTKSESLQTLSPVGFDRVELTRVVGGVADGSIESVIFKSGGEDGSSLRTLDFSYDANGNLENIQAK